LSEFIDFAQKEKLPSCEAVKLQSDRCAFDMSNVCIIH